MGCDPQQQDGTMLWLGEPAFDWTAAPEHKPRMENLEKVAMNLCFWLAVHGIGVDRIATIAETEADELTFEFGFRIPNAYMDDFLEVELDFWKVVQEHCPLNIKFVTHLYSPDFQVGDTIATSDDDFLVIIAPDPTSVRYAFPPRAFWEKRLQVVECERESRWAKEQYKWRMRGRIKLVVSNPPPDGSS